MIHVGHKFYWILPLFSALVWLGMLLGLFLWWVIDTGKAQLPSMAPDQNIAYISDTGAFTLQPLFIAGSCVVVICLDLAFLMERWLRHSGRLAPNTSRSQKAMSICSIIFAIAGAAGLILLSIFNDYKHKNLHDGFLVLFIAGYVISAIFICAEYAMLGWNHRSHPFLAVSFFIKLGFICIELPLAICFGYYNSSTGKNYNHAAIFEWVIALIFTGYILTFMLDLFPAAIPSKSHRWHTHGVHGKDDIVEPVTEMRMQDDVGVNGDRISYPESGRF